MSTRIIAFALCMIAFGPSGVSARQTSSVAGRWEGAVTLDVVNVALQIAVAFTDGAGGLSATIDIQNSKGVPLSAVSVKGQTVHFELPSPIGTATFDGRFDGTAISGKFTQNNNTGTFTLMREGGPKPAAVKPEVPYREEDVTFKNGDITLAGTLSIPEGKGPFPAFVMVTGSGLQNRDEEVFGFKVFAVISDYLVRHGFATLRSDDRGAGGSTGSIAAASSADFADDALAGVALLRSRPEIDRAHVGVLGHSEGADVAAIAAAKAPDKVSFIVMMAGPAVPGAEVLRYQTEDAARSLGATGEQVARILKARQQVSEAIKSNAGTPSLTAAMRELITAQLEGRSPEARAVLGDVNAWVEKTLPGAVAQARSPWMRYFVSYDPAPILEQVKCPVYAMFGGRDIQVRPDMNRKPLEADLGRGGNRQVTVKVYEDANHLFQKANTGQVAEYATLEKAFVPGMLDDLAAWLKSVTK